MILGSIVLAGGDSSRMGQSKAGLRWGEDTLLLRAVQTLLDCSWPVVVVARDEAQELPPLHTECELVFDDHPGQGPLAAIESGLRALGDRCDAALVTACDMPFVDDRVVGWLARHLGDHSGVVPEVDGRPQPLCGLYHVRLLAAIHDLVRAGEQRASAMAELAGVQQLSAATVAEFDSSGRFAMSVNSPEDYQRALGLAGLA